MLSPTSASVIFIISVKASFEKNFPTGPLAEASLSMVKYANPDAP